MSNISRTFILNTPGWTLKLLTRSKISQPKQRRNRVGFETYILSKQLYSNGHRFPKTTYPLNFGRIKGHGQFTVNLVRIKWQEHKLFRLVCFEWIYGLSDWRRRFHRQVHQKRKWIHPNYLNGNTLVAQRQPKTSVTVNYHFIIKLSLARVSPR